MFKYFNEIIETLTETLDSDENLIKYARMACQILFCDIENICSKWPSLALNEIYIKPRHVAEAAKMRSNRDLSSNLIKQALELIMEEEKYRNSCLSDIVTEQGWLDSFRDKERIQIMVSDAIKDHKKLVGKYIRGNTKGFETSEEQKTADEDRFSKFHETLVERILMFQENSILLAYYYHVTN